MNKLKCYGLKIIRLFLFDWIDFFVFFVFFIAFSYDGGGMPKLNIAGIVLVIVGFISAIHFGYNNYQEKKQLQKDKAELFGKIEQLEQNIAKNNQIIADNEQSKRELENESIKRQEQINEQLKNNDCANQFVPVSISSSLYNRAKSLRQSTDTGKFAQ